MTANIIVQFLNFDMNQLKLDSIFSQMVILAIAPAIGLGIARFAYALVLPEMQSALDWSYSQAGWMNTINAGGYLLGALSTAYLADRYSLWNVFRTGIWLSIIALFMSGFVTDFYIFSFWRLLAGMAGAFCFVGGGSIAAVLASEAGKNSGKLLSLFYAGPGLGIALSGAIIPPYLQNYHNESWSTAWIVLGTVSGFLGIFTLLLKEPGETAKF